MIFIKGSDEVHNRHSMLMQGFNLQVWHILVVCGGVDKIGGDI